MKIRVFIAVLQLVLLGSLLSCSVQVTADSTGITIDRSQDPASYFAHWSRKIDAAETRWQSAQIDDYTVTGQASWGWHEHSFEVKVRNGNVVDSTCQLKDDAPVGSEWCNTEFDPSVHTMPGLFEQARILLEYAEDFNYEFLDEFEACFSSAFAYRTGVPAHILFDCPSAHDEQEEWKIDFKALP